MAAATGRGILEPPPKQVSLNRPPGGLRSVRVFIPLLLAAYCAGAQSEFSDRLTFSGGWTRQVGGYSYEPKETALPGFGLSYAVKLPFLTSS